MVERRRVTGSLAVVGLSEGYPTSGFEGGGLMMIKVVVEEAKSNNVMHL